MPFSVDEIEADRLLQGSSAHVRCMPGEDGADKSASKQALLPDFCVGTLSYVLLLCLG